MTSSDSSDDGLTGSLLLLLLSGPLIYVSRHNFSLGRRKLDKLDDRLMLILRIIAN